VLVADELQPITFSRHDQTSGMGAAAPSLGICVGATKKREVS
jgi:hypothetical protein